MVPSSPSAHFAETGDETEEKISKEAMDNFLKRQPLGLGDPEDVANAIIFFLSDNTKWITGANLPLGGA